jgi:N-methylhydantoinase A
VSVWRLGVDVGGTFTDLVAVGDGRIVTAKVPSTPHNQADAVMHCINAAHVDARDVANFAHGTTVATNALLERTGARTALLTTEGFRDVIEIGRQNRPSLYDLTRDRPPALVPRALRFTVRERMGPDGEITPLDEGGLVEAVAKLERAEVESVAVCFLFAFMHPDHERRAAAVLSEELRGVHVSLSSEVLPEFREYERFATTVADAYLAPGLARYLTDLTGRLEDTAMPSPLVMQSSGGVVGIRDATRRAAACVLSGPAAGVVGAVHVATKAGFGNALTIDMGGTSTDVATVLDGRVRTTTESVIGGIPIKFPMVDVHSVGAGGGSIAWTDEGGALRVGPASAGAEPGPASYGKGGEDATVTDANLVLGYLSAGTRLGSRVVLDHAPAEKSLEAIGKRIGCNAVEAAQGVVRVANAEMVRALRVMSVERGLDPKDLVLVAFGGAGPMHACSLAEELGMRTILVPGAGGVLSALGLAISDVRRDYVRPFFSPLDELDARRVEETLEGMEADARKNLDEPQLERFADLRYRGQSFELTTSADPPEGMAARFHLAHERRYGYAMSDEVVEVVNVRVVATVFTDTPEWSEWATDCGSDESPDRSSDSRKTYVDGAWIDSPVRHASKMSGRSIEGPAIVELPGATCVVRPGWSGRINEQGTLVLTSNDD